MLVAEQIDQFRDGGFPSGSEHIDSKGTTPLEGVSRRAEIELDEGLLGTECDHLFPERGVLASHHANEKWNGIGTNLTHGCFSLPDGFPPERRPAIIQVLQPGA